MRKWSRQLQLECRLLFTNRLLWPLPPLFGLWFAYTLTAIEPDVSQNIYLYAYDFHKLQHTLSLGIAMLIGMLLIRKDMVRPSYEWSAGLPVSSSAFIAAKYTAGLLYLSLFTFAMAAVYAGFGILAELPVSELRSHLSFFAVQYTVSYMVTLALAMLLAVLIPNRVCYMIGFCAWIFGTFFLDVFLISRLRLYDLKTFHLSQFFTNSLWENDVWGPYLLSEELWLSRRFVLCFTLWMLATVVMLIHKKRPSGAYRSSVTAMLLALLASVLAFVPYEAMWQERFSAYEKKLQDAPPDYADRTSYGESSFSVSSYELTVHRHPDDRLDVTAAVQLDAPPQTDGTSMTFTLNRDFVLKKLSVNGKPVPAKQTGDLVSFDRAALEDGPARQTLLFEYEGKLFNWYPASSYREVVNGFVRGDLVYLPSHLAWYPIPGKQVLYVQDTPGTFRDRYEAGHELLADFDVKLTGFTGELFGTIRKQPEQGDFTQSFKQDKTNGVTLFAGHLTEIRIPGETMAILTSPANKHEAEKFLKAYSDIMAYYDSWLSKPLPKPEAMLYMPLHMVAAQQERSIHQAAGNRFVFSESLHTNLDAFQLAQMVHVSLFGDRNAGIGFPGEGPGSSLVGSIRRAFYQVYQAEHPKRQEETPLGAGLLYPRFPVGAGREAAGDPVDRAVQKAIREGRLDHVKRVLDNYYSKGLSIEGEWAYRYPIIQASDWEQAWSGGAKHE
ncbi:hypothetical protein P9314_09750 [Paenibacillus validus]|uniref:hypothetical protein n=1 Tax=Paenibacillus validus TaxID=44253 RepID=UPI000FD86A50|nr:hypothetical protein [Paenibacillus validus]MED4600983.1 hypothetical protein [Paenibacillus validus]MED4604970.1 hypothetical protein [Paenibacillus validus]